MIRGLNILAVALLPVALAAWGCTPPDGDELQDEDLKLDVSWDDVMGQSTPAAAGEQDATSALPESALPSERLAHLPENIRRQPALAYLAVSRFLNEPVAYEGGIYGLMGTAKVFVAPSTQITDDHHLYYVMVKVLSEKYACFMSAKQNLGTRTRVTCRDGRQVMFWQSRGPDWVGFRARQYDGQGYEVQVRHHRVVRVDRDSLATY